MFRRSVRRFVETELAPHEPRWRAQHRPDAEAWAAAGRAGMLLPGVPGGIRRRRRHLRRTRSSSARSSPAPACISAAASRASSRTTSSPTAARSRSSAGCRGWRRRARRRDRDDRARRRLRPAGDQDDGAPRRRHYVVNGSKTFITNGWHAGLVCLAVKTDTAVAADEGPVAARGRDRRTLPATGRALAREDRHARAGHLRAVLRRRARAGRKPARAGRGPGLLPDDGAAALRAPDDRRSAPSRAAERAVAITTDYVKERKAFGKPLIEFQNTRFKLAECKTEAQIGRVFVDNCIERFIAGSLDEVDRAMAKYWLTETPVPDHRRMRAAARRLRLHDRIPDRPHVGRQPRAAHLRRHERDHEGDDRHARYDARTAPGSAKPTRERLLYRVERDRAADSRALRHELFERQAARHARGGRGGARGSAAQLSRARTSAPTRSRIICAGSGVGPRGAASASAWSASPELVVALSRYGRPAAPTCRSTRPIRRSGSPSWSATRGARVLLTRRSCARCFRPPATASSASIPIGRRSPAESAERPGSRGACRRISPT